VHPAFGLIFIVIVVVLIIFGPSLDRSKNGKNFGLSFGISPKLRCWFFAVFASFWTLVAFGFTYCSYWELVGAYRTSNYSVGEWTVEDFHPMPYEGHQSEASASKRKNFGYLDYDVAR